MVIPLCDIRPGQKATIVRLDHEPFMAGRLYDLGFAPGAAVTCVLQRPRKNISAYLVRNAVIALRRRDSRLIMAEKEAPQEQPAAKSPVACEADTPENSAACEAGTLENSAACMAGTLENSAACEAGTPENSAACMADTPEYSAACMAGTPENSAACAADTSEALL